MVRKFLSTRSLLQAPLQIMASSVVASTVRHNIEGNGEWQPMYCNAQRVDCDDGIGIHVWLDATYREQDKHSYHAWCCDEPSNPFFYQTSLGAGLCFRLIVDWLIIRLTWSYLRRINVLLILSLHLLSLSSHSNQDGRHQRIYESSQYPGTLCFCH